MAEYDRLPSRLAVKGSAIGRRPEFEGRVGVASVMIAFLADPKGPCGVRVSTKGEGRKCSAASAWRAIAVKRSLSKGRMIDRVLVVIRRIQSEL